jgi:hypothetical protein
MAKVEIRGYAKSADWEMRDNSGSALHPEGRIDQLRIRVVVLAIA